jgi:serine phosphatase RsbU (regulator of sigma subunit)
MKIKDEVINEDSLKIIKTFEHKNEVLRLKSENEFEQKRNLELQIAYGEIEIQRNLITIKNKEITDSITYAKRIQEAILPSDTKMKDLFPDSFVIYNPKDILSGDFYWATKILYKDNEENLLVALADCTGHGVPGALLSIVGHNFLRLCEIEASVTNPSQALFFLNQGMCETLQQKTGENSIKDGMDISFVSLNLKRKKIQFSGANHSMYIIRNGVMLEIRGDRHPIGSFYEGDEKLFTNHELDLVKGDQVYLFTDGYGDQFGGPLGKKFRQQAFKQLLVSIVDLPLIEQREVIVKKFDEWKGDLEQLDDVCIFSVKI